MVRFGQVVVGPPGSGKTTYCLGMRKYLKAIGRDAAVINLDPANHGEGLPYTPEVDIEELVSLEVGVRYDSCIDVDSTKGDWRKPPQFVASMPVVFVVVVVVTVSFYLQELRGCVLLEDCTVHTLNTMIGTVYYFYLI